MERSTIVARQGEHHPAVPVLKRMFGYGTIDDVFDVSMVHRIRGIQMVHCMRTHGQLDNATLRVLGVDVE